MIINNEQFNKLMDLSELKKEYECATSDDITKALIAIERKLSFCSTDINNLPADFNILIVDDLELSIYQFNQLLKKVGITPTVARTKIEALAELKKRRYDFVVVDLFLPDFEDGLELINECIKIKESKNINKIIVMSGTDDKSLIEKCYNLGIDEFIPKFSNWHDNILKFISSSLSSKDSEDFFKYSINDNICCYNINKFNGKRHIDNILKDVNTTLYAGFSNIIFNMEYIKMFDDEYTNIFTELYKISKDKGGQFVLVKISDSVKSALSDAFLDNLIPVYPSVEVAVSKLSN